MNKHVFELLNMVIASLLVLAIPAGFTLMIYYDTAWWLLLSLGALAALYAG